MKAQGVLEGDAVIIRDEAQANRLHNKGAFGEPQSGNALRLSLAEAAYNVQNERLDVAGADFADLVRDDVTYLAYADLRDRGLVVRHDGHQFLVWRRGEGPKQAPWFTFTATSERDPMKAASLQPGVVGVVDEDGVVTHYLVETAEPEGVVQGADLAARDADVLRDCVLTDPDGLAEEFIGTPHGERRIVSFTEAQWLHERGVLSLPGLEAAARERQHHFDRTLPVYTDLRRRGVVAKSGFRFGTHLRGYRGNPDEGHAEWLIQCADPDEAMHWSEISRAVRLAHGVRKTFLIATTEPRYLALSWFRP